MYPPIYINMKIINEKDNKHYTLNTVEIDVNNIPNLNNKVSLQILDTIKNIPMYPKQIAKKLKIHEQNIYYYIRKLEKSNIIKIAKEENINGTTAKFYTITSDSYYFKIKQFKETSKVTNKSSNYLSPFIENGELKAIIIVGSPDPHGPQKARSRDGYFGIDFALFLGSYLSSISQSKVKLDTEITNEEIKNNHLIVIGGPIVNKVTNMINENIPIHFDEDKKGMYSKITKKTYFNDEIGVINKIVNPYNKDKMILSIVGLRNSGIKASILAFLKHFNEIKKGNNIKEKIHSKVVEGIDLDSDGIVDEVEILE